MHWRDWCWSWNFNTLATWCEELTLWKRPWCWERLKEGRKGDDRGWDGWMTSPTQWTWVWVDSRSWWWTGRPGVLRFMGSQKVGHDWANELNWTQLNSPIPVHFSSLIPRMSHSLLPSLVWPLPICFDPWTRHSRFLCSIALYSIRLYFCHQTHSQLGGVFALALSLHSFWSYFSTVRQ